MSNIPYIKRRLSSSTVFFHAFLLYIFFFSIRFNIAIDVFTISSCYFLILVLFHIFPLLAFPSPPPPNTQLTLLSLQKCNMVSGEDEDYYSLSNEFLPNSSQPQTSGTDLSFHEIRSSVKVEFQLL